MSAWEKFLKSYAWKWLKAAGKRAIRTFAQTAAGMITVGAMASEIDWAAVLSVAGVAAIYSLLMAVAGVPELKDESQNGGE